MTPQHRIFFAFWIMMAVLIAVRTYPKSPPPKPPSPVEESPYVTYDDGKIYVSQSAITTVRSYNRENDWCIIYVDGKSYAVEGSHDVVWKKRWDKEAPPILTFKLYNNGVDPCETTDATSASSTKEK